MIRRFKDFFRFDPARVSVALSFLREPRRWLTAAGAVAFGTVGLILAEGFIEQIFRDWREEIVRSHYGHVQVLPAESVRAKDGSAVTLPPIGREVEAALSEFRGATIAGRLGFVGLASHGERTISFMGEGVDPDKELTLSKAVSVVAGRALSAADAKEVVVGEGLARGLGLKVGEKLTVLVNTPGGGINAAELDVVGFFYTSVKAYDDRALRLPLATAQKLVRLDGVSQLIAVLDDTRDAPRAKARLVAALAGREVEVKSWEQLADFYNKTVELFDRQLSVVRAIVVAIVLLSISNSVARNVMERTREIGTMMALGATRGAVARRFVGEAFGIGVVGALAGVVLGALLAWLVTLVGIPMPPPPGTARGYDTGIAFSPSMAVTAAAFTIFSAVLASALPSWRASRMSIVDALRSGR